MCKEKWKSSEIQLLLKFIASNIDVFTKSAEMQFPEANQSDQQAHWEEDLKETGICIKGLYDISKELFF